MKNQFIFVFLLVFALAGVLPSAVEADEEDIGFSVQANLPENQLESNQTYFDLRVEPEQKQTLQVGVYNHEDEELTIDTEVYNASTNSNGLIVYEEQEEIDSSLEVPLTDLVTLEQTQVTIPPGESKTVDAELKMPDDEQDGIILGGIYFHKNAEEDSSEGVNIQNEYSYVVGVQLSENDNDVAPELDLTSVEPNLVNHRPVVKANIQNSQPAIVSDLSMQAEVYKKGEDEVLQEQKADEMKMAPNSNMDFNIDWDNKTLEPGDYTLKMTATDTDNDWAWEQDFTVEKEEAKQLEEESVDENEASSNLWLIVGISILALIVVVLLLYIWRLKSNKESNF